MSGGVLYIVLEAGEQPNENEVDEALIVEGGVFDKIFEEFLLVQFISKPEVELVLYEFL